MIETSFTALSALLFVVALLFGFLWIVRRMGLVPGHPTNPLSKKEIEILEVKALDTRNRLVAVRWRGQDMLLASGQEGTRIVTQQPTAVMPSGASVDTKNNASKTPDANSQDADND